MVIRLSFEVLFLLRVLRRDNNLFCSRNFCKCRLMSSILLQGKEKKTENEDLSFIGHMFNVSLYLSEWIYQMGPPSREKEGGERERERIEAIEQE